MYAGNGMWLRMYRENAYIMKHIMERSSGNVSNKWSLLRKKCPIGNNSELLRNDGSLMSYWSFTGNGQFEGIAHY